MMIKVRELATLDRAELATVMRRAEQDIASLLPTAQGVIDKVKADGDAALVEFTRKFDAPNFSVENLCPTREDFARARQEVGEEVVNAIQAAHDNIRQFHEEQMPEPMWFTELQPGVM